MSGDFADKVVVVTGGSRGIGRGIAEAFAREGAQTVLVASSQQNLDQAAKAIAATGAPAPMAIACDLRKLAGCEDAFRQVDERFHRCDILVNNAGATRRGDFLKLDDETWMDGYALKLFGCVRLCRLFWPLLVEAQGHVLNIVGAGARTPTAEFTIGGSVNAAMANFSKALADRGKADGVNVNVIHPGVIVTDRLFAHAAGTGMSREEVLARALKREGTRRLGEVDDVAALALFLCGEQARHIQGTAIAVDGGATPGFY